MKKGRVVFYFLLIIFMGIFNFYLRPIKGNPLIDNDYKNSSSYINGLYKSDEFFKKKLLKESDYHIYDEIIKNALNAEYEVTVECNKECGDAFADAYKAIYLDHPELLSFLGIGSYRKNGTQIVYKNYESLGKIRGKLATMRIEREIDNVRRDTVGMSDKEKIIYVYDYVASHKYDHLFKLSGTNQSIYSFFTKGSSVCAGFAKVSQIIFQNIGINSYLVLSSNHMWNYVEYEGKYYIFDATMGSSFSNDNPMFYDGLGMTTTGVQKGLYSKYYPKIETKTTLKEIFGI